MTDEELIPYRMQLAEDRLARIEGDHKALSDVIPVMKEQVASLGKKVDKLDAAAGRVTVALYGLATSTVVAAFIVVIGR